MKLFILLCLILSVLSEELSEYEFVLSIYTTAVYYNLERYLENEGNTHFVTTNVASDRLYTVQVVGPVEFDYDDATCTTTRTNPIVVGPQACSVDRVVSNRCTDTFEDAVILQNLLESLFSVRPESSECIRNGGTEKTCLGPLYTFITGVSRPIPMTNETLLRSSGVGAASGVGYGCGTPAITYLDIKLPKLLVATDCTDDFSQEFSGVYVPIDTDPFEGLDITEAYARELVLVQHRLLLRRYGYDFYLQLADVTGSLDYEVFYTSRDPVPADFEYYLPISLESNSSTCVFNVSMQGISLPLELNPSEEITPLNYYQNKLPTHFERTLACGFEICRLTETGELAIPNCPEGEFRGGSDFGVITSGVTEVPVKIPADDSYKHYVEECETFYPWGSEFRVFTGSGNLGAFQARQVGFTCHGPYYNPFAIISSVNPEAERSLQCFRMGGWVSGTTRSYCSRQTDMRRCERDWVYFDGWCYYKFDYDTNADSYVPDSLSDTICGRLGSDVQVYDGRSVDESQWLQAVYIGWKRKDGGYPYRVRVSGELCECYDYAPELSPPRTVFYCDCQRSYFPICRYKKEDRIIPYEDISMSPITHQLMLNGRDGQPWTGVPRKCVCGIGSTGPYCNSGTCPSFVDVTTGASSILASFFAKCYFQNRGGCDNKNPSTCACFENYGPPASLNPVSPYYKFREWPCACPKAVNPSYGEQGFQLNEVRYLDKIGICGGVNRGWCSLENSTTLARCVSVLRVDLSEGLLRRSEPAYNGKANEGRIAVKPANNYFVNSLVTEGFCNSRGGVCGSGEYQRDVIVTGQDVSYYWRTICLDSATSEPRSGCVCDSGWTGDSCTCPVPQNVAVGLVVQRLDNINYIQFSDPVTVAYIRTEPVRYDSTTIAAGCSPLSVSLSDGLRSRKLECVFEAGNGWNTEDIWVCNFGIGLFVEVSTLEVLPECVIEVYPERFSPCGNWTNPSAGRFSANEFYRGESLVMEEQPIEYAPFGCTTTECMCDSNHSGKRCGVEISGYRRSDSGDFTAMMCGEDTEPQRGVVNLEEGRCDCFKTSDFDMSSTACACASQYVVQLDSMETCAANGVCEVPSFPSGLCGFDVDDFESDPLSSPFSSNVTLNFTRPYVVQERDASIWDNYGAGDRRSVFTVEGYSWLFDSTDELLFESVYNNISICAPRVRFPLNMTYYCTTVSPVRGVSNTTIWTLGFDNVFRSYTELCDPSVFDESDPLMCSSTQFCKEEWLERGSFNLTDVDNTPVVELKTCIAGMIWQPLAGSEDVLESGFYPNTHAICANALDPSANDTDVLNTPYAIFDCSNPVDRILDDAVFLLSGSRQCNSTISPYSFVLGQGYGLFFNQIPSLLFLDEDDWTDEHYRFIGSLLSDQRCSVDVFSEILFNDITVGWITDNTDPLLDLESNSTDALFSVYNNDRIEDRPSNWEFVGEYGSQVLNSIQSWPSLISFNNYTWANRAGNFAFLPRFTENSGITQLVIEAQTDLGGLQVVSSEGITCGTILHPLRAGERVTLNCIEAFTETDQEAYFRIYNESLPGVNITEIAQAWSMESPSQDFIWWYEKDQYDIQFGNSWINSSHPPFLRRNIAGAARDNSIPSFFNALRGQILLDNRFPNTTVYRDACLLGGYEIIDMNYSATDRAYLRDFYYTHLSPRRCTGDWQCETFARSANTECIPDSDVWVPWRNGDSSKYPFEGIGREGGCACYANYTHGYYSLSQMCGACDNGLGPYTDTDWLSAVEYQEALITQYPDLALNPPSYSNESWGLNFSFYGMQERVTCRLPWDYSTTRSSGLCAGFGRLSNLSLETIEYETVVFTSSLGIPESRRCTGLIVDGYYHVLQNETLTLEMFSYTNATTTINVIGDDLYLNDGQEYTFPLENCKDSTKCRYSNSHLVECSFSPQPVAGYRISSSSERVSKSFLYNYEIV